MRASHRVLTVGGIAIAAIAIAGEVGAQANVLANGNMEMVSGGAISGWQLQKPAEATASIQSVETPVKSGKRALALRGQGPWMSVGSPSMQINAASPYRASAWIRTKKGHARIQINYWAAEKWLGASDGVQRITKDEWQQVSVESDPNRFSGVTRLSVGIVSDGPDVEVYVDDVVMTTR
ncbi:MAG: hypothetical protein ACT4PS_19285 [Betaproteobacteria bacterium]